MVFVCVDRLEAWLAACAVPYKGVVVLVAQDVAKLQELALKCLDAVGLLYLKACQACKPERYVHQCARYDNGLCQVGSSHKVVVESGQQAGLRLKLYNRA